MREFQKQLFCTIMIDISFTPFPFLATENYALRNLLPEDEQEIFALRSSDEINKYLDRPKANTPDDAPIQDIVRSSVDRLDGRWKLSGVEPDRRRTRSIVAFLV